MPQKGELILEVRDLTVKVAGKQILNGLSLQVRAGEVHAIMGPNGSGKSTLASVLAGRSDYEVVGGSVSYLGRDLLALPPEARAREGVFLADTVYCMSRSPGRFVVKRDIELPRPRDLEITYTPQFTDIVHELRGHIGAMRKPGAAVAQ